MTAATKAVRGVVRVRAGLTLVWGRVLAKLQVRQSRPRIGVTVKELTTEFRTRVIRRPYGAVLITQFAPKLRRPLPETEVTSMTMSATKTVKVAVNRAFLSAVKMLVEELTLRMIRDETTTFRTLTLETGSVDALTRFVTQL